MSDVSVRLEAAKEIARQAGGLLKLNFGKEVSFSRKSDGSLVSAADIASEKKIVTEIKARFPGDSVLSEEGAGDGRGGGGFLWVIDPLDGTHNYIKGIDLYGTSIAVCEGRRVAAGAIFIPSSGELFYASDGEGAYCGSEKISVSQRPLGEATMLFDSSISRARETAIAALDKLSGEVFNIRMLGSTVCGLVSIACGRAELEIEFCDRMWDFAAGLKIIEEAGGLASGLKGEAWNIDTQGYIASNGVFHDEIIRSVNL